MLPTYDRLAPFCNFPRDPRLPEAAYPFVRNTLDKLLASRLPAVRIHLRLAFNWRRPIDGSVRPGTAAAIQLRHRP
jgi:hypothetical protein